MDVPDNQVKKSAPKYKIQAKCSLVKLIVISIFIFIIVAALCAILPNVLSNSFLQQGPDNEFSTERLVRYKSGDAHEDREWPDGDRDWVVIQRRRMGNVSFNRTWDEYRKGFGSRSGDFWFGNDNIHSLTQRGYTRLRITFETFDGTLYSLSYGHFSLGGEDDKYRLSVSGYNPGFSGIKHDCLHYHDGTTFSTYDRDNDRFRGVNCAMLYGGWWYDACQEANLNGVYRTGGEYIPGETIWCYIDKNKGIKYTQMMIKKNYVKP